MKQEKKDIGSFRFEELKEEMTSIGEKAFRAKQIYEWLHVKQFHLEDIKTLPLDGSAILLDTRTPEEYERGHVAGFTNIPVDVLREHLKELPKEKPIYVMCQSGLRSYIATRILEGNGYRAYNFSGGFRFYDAVMNDRCLIASAAACGMDQA